MKAPLILPVLVLMGGTAAFFMSRGSRSDPPPAKPAPTKAEVQAPVEPATVPPEESKTEKPAPPSGNRFAGPHDGRHTRAGFECAACKYKPLIF